MLDPELKEGIRRSAEAISSALTDAERQEAGQLAHKIIDRLHEAFPDDDTAAHAAIMFASLFVTITELPVRNLNSILVNGIDTYTLAAGRLAGVYELPLREDDPDEEASDDGPPPYIPAPVGEDVESPGTGFYL